MKAQNLHDWQLTPEQARKLQRELAGTVSGVNEAGNVRLIAGVDISAPDATGLARAAVVVLSYPELTPIESKVVKRRVTFPYVPGLLSFREAPLVIAACEELEHNPDLIMVDGQGIAHPRRFGIASHLGLLWDKPTIGCAKSRLCGQHKLLPPEAGSYAELLDKGEVIGAVLRTKLGAQPLYISIGHKVDLESALSWVLKCCRGQRLPEPTRLAHLAASNRLDVIEPVKTEVQRIRLSI
ncbi:MAG TPA: deoxyribonuclease V [Dehalococcoidia bacterium]|nr:deoxyribonuclease V [Dehalococcoidia bacterium]